MMTTRALRSASLSSPADSAYPGDIGRRIAARWSPAPLAAASALALGLAATPAFAKTFTVNKFDPTAEGGDTTCDATCTLRDAIDDANNNPGPDIVKFTASTAVRSITLAADAELKITDAVSIIGPHRGLLTISGDSSRIFILSTATGKDVVISGMTLTNGNGTGLNDPGVDGKGGAIFNNSADLVMSDIALTSNTASSGGGAFFLAGSGTLSLSDCVITGNTTAGFGGVAYVLVGDDFLPFVLKLNHCTVSDNIAANSGGAFFLLPDSPVIIENTTISGNTATAGDGGGVFAFTTAARGNMIFRRSTISGNTAFFSGGGMEIRNTINGLVLVENSTLSGNTAGTAAGDRGGGINVASGSNENLVWVRNSTIAGDNSAHDGGGIALASGGDVLLENSIVADNIATGTANEDLFANGGSNNFISDRSIFETVSLALSTSGAGGIQGQFFHLSPQLEALADYGGPTATHALKFDSPAIDRGNPNTCSGYDITRDQRGVTRPVDAGTGLGKICDIGAYEFNGNVVACTPSPLMSCDSTTKGSLAVVDGLGTKTDSVKAAITGLQTDSTTFFGDPTHFLGTPAAVCIYAGGDLVGSYNVPAGGVSSTGAPLWKLASTGLATFTLSTGNADGVTLLSLKPSPTQTSTTGAVALTTKTGAVTVPYDPNVAAGNMLTLPVVLQFTTDDECVSTEFSTASANTPLKFTAVK